MPTGNCPVFFRSIPVLSGRNTAPTKSPELPGTDSFQTGLLFDLGIPHPQPQVSKKSCLGFGKKAVFSI
jgi:hypothetical protein